MQGLNPLTMQCIYSTPCGWCAKWDKKCDKKIGCDNEKAKNPCINCSDYGWADPKCPTCRKENYKFFTAKEN